MSTLHMPPVPLWIFLFSPTVFISLLDIDVVLFREKWNTSTFLIGNVHVYTYTFKSSKSKWRVQLTVKCMIVTFCFPSNKLSHHIVLVLLLELHPRAIYLGSGERTAGSRLRGVRLTLGPSVLTQRALTQHNQDAFLLPEDWVDGNFPCLASRANHSSLLTKQKCK